MLKEAITEIKNALGYFRRMGRTLEKTREYIENNKHNKDSANAPEFHFTAPLGWLNDPNGFIYFKGKYHLFYQYNPYGTEWGPMYWGHAVSYDLIKWEHLPIALAPDTEHDKGGVWSGSAIEKDGKLYVMYSGNIHKGQVQNIAFSDDGINFTKYQGNPVIDNKKLPKGFSKINFRDPKIYNENGIFYAVIATKNKGKPIIARFKSADIYNWEFDTILYAFPDRKMRECPDYFTLNGKKVLLCSSKDGNSYWYIGYEEGGKFHSEDSGLLDCGLDFYAPQTLQADGRRIMIAWMQKWGRNIPSTEYGYAGMMTIPRELTVTGGKIYQKPVSELKNFYIESVCYNNLEIGNEETEPFEKSKRGYNLRINTDLKGEKALDIMLLASDEEEFEICLYEDGLMFLRTELKNRINKARLKDNTVYISSENSLYDLEIIADKFAVEAFLDGKAYSFTAYPVSNENRILIRGAKNPLINIEKNDLGG